MKKFTKREKKWKRSIEAQLFEAEEIKVELSVAGISATAKPNGRTPRKRLPK